MTSLGSLLIVEDDLPLCAMLEMGFADLGYQVTTARGCQQAERLADNASFDFALLDYHLPDGDGIGLALWLANKSAKTRIALMSAVPPDQIDGAILVRLSGLFRKPIAIQTIHRCFSTQEN